LLIQNRVSGIHGKLSFDPQEPLVLEPGAGVGTTDRPAVRAMTDSHLTNAAALRAELERLGHHWSDGSDAALVAHAYAEWGPSCVMRLRGPFACAIWDDSARRLVLARDQIGIRHLYFALLPDHGIVFASEAGALLRDPQVGREWSAPAIDAYLALGYVPAPLTPYRRITKLEPAQLIVVEGRRLRSEQYCDFPAAAQHRSLDAHVVDAVDHGLRRAVRRTLTPGDTSTLLYSGGLASSALLTAWPRDGRAPLTVAIDQDPTELTRSEAAAAHLGRARDLEAFNAPIPVTAAALAAAFDEPIADPGAVTQFAICTAVRRHAERAVTGHGAAALWLDAGHQRPAVWDGFARRDVYTRSFAWQVRDSDPRADARAFLADSTLTAVHRATAAAGVELCFPFLEHDLVQLAFAAAAAPRHWGRRRDLVLQHLLQRQLPRPLLPSPTHEVPQPWLAAALGSMVPAILMTPRFDGRGIMSRPALAELWNDHRAGRRDHAHRLWAIVMLECWFREHIDGEAANEPLEYAALVRVA
jgi:asparagine synthetase B (glutamine-hydrolysing)